jgi:Sec-independent protein translocase protein TatA
MWLWVLLFAVLAVAGLVLLGALAWRLYGKARDLGRTVAEATERLTAATEALEQASSGRESTGPAGRGASRPEGRR